MLERISFSDVCVCLLLDCCRLNGPNYINVNSEIPILVVKQMFGHSCLIKTDLKSKFVGLSISLIRPTVQLESISVLRIFEDHLITFTVENL